jgi:hypothetical protein
MTGREGNKLVNLMQFTSEQTNYMGGLILFSTIWLIIFLALMMRGSGFKVSFVATSFSMFFIAIGMYALQLIGGVVLVFSIVLLPISVLLLFIES